MRTRAVILAVARRIAAMGRVAIAIAVVSGVAIMIAMAGGVAIVIGAMMIAALLIGRIGREVAGTAIGRALVGIVILVHRSGISIILLFRIGQPLIGRGAAAGVAAGINRSRNVALRARLDISLSARRARALEQSASARHRGRDARGHHGNCRYQS